jgi:hypothetical protein
MAGHQAGQASREHEARLAENKLQAMVLKHHLSALKLDDQLRQQQIAEHVAALQEGRPARDFYTSVPQAPPGSVAPGVTMPNAAPPEVVKTAPAPVTIPGIDVPELGIAAPGTTRTPRTMEDLLQQHILTKQLENDLTLHNVPQGGTLTTGGGKVVARGQPRPLVIPRGGTAIDPTAPSGTPPIATGQPFEPTSEFAQFQQVYAERLGGTGTKFNDLTPQQKAGVFAAFAQERQDPEARAARREATADRQDRQAWERDFRQYSSEIAIAQRKHAAELKAWGADIQNMIPGKGTPAPEYAPPSFDEWRASRPAPPAKGTTPAPKKAATPAVTDPLIVTDPKSGKSYRAPTKAAADAMRREFGVR